MLWVGPGTRIGPVLGGAIVRSVSPRSAASFLEGFHTREMEDPASCGQEDPGEEDRCWRLVAGIRVDGKLSLAVSPRQVTPVVLAFAPSSHLPSNPRQALVREYLTEEDRKVLLGTLLVKLGEEP